MTAPCRIQRKRTKGWRAPPGAVYVGRGTMWGNPFATAAEYAEWLECGGHPWRASQRLRILRRLPELRGKVLMCWCPEGEPCHADELLRGANAPEGIPDD